MSTFRRNDALGGPSLKGVLGTLRDVKIVDSKPVLPAEILSMVLDFLSVSDLISCASVSKRMREMVYDDTRWIRKLRMMGCWDEAAARAKAERSILRLGGRHTIAKEPSLDKVESEPEINHVPDMPNLILPNVPYDASTQSSHAYSSEEHSSQSDGFLEVPLAHASSQTYSPAEQGETSAALQVLDHVRSVRGSARQEYGRVYAVLRPFYRDAIRTKNPSNAKIFRTYRDPNQQARMLAQVLRFAASDCSLGHTLREQKLATMTEAFENAVYHEFEQGLDMGDVDGRMKKYANVLVTLNGGQRAVNQFIRQNKLLERQSELGDPTDCLNDMHPDMLFIEQIDGFFERLTTAINDQMQIITRVFPPSVEVAKAFLDDIGRKICVSYVNNLLNLVHEQSTESYLRATSSTYQHCLQLLETLRFPSRSRENCTTTLYDIINEIFAFHIETYLTEELGFFKRKSDAEVDGWERQLSQQDASIESLYMSNVNRQADKRDFLSSFRKVVMLPMNAFPFGARSNVNAKTAIATETLEPPQSAISRPVSRPVSRQSSRADSIDPLGARGIGMSRSPSPSAEAPTTELAAKAAIMKSRLEGIRSLFSLEVALNLVHMAKASIDRTASFAHAGGKFNEEARKQCGTIFVLLLKTLGDRHVRTGFDQAVEHLANYNPRSITDRSEAGSQVVAPLVVFLELVNVGDLIQQMLDVFYEQELVATSLVDRNDFLSPTVKEKKRFEQMLDERVAAGLNKGIEVLITEVEYICGSTQSPEDYNPDALGSTNAQNIDISPTDTAIRVVHLVSSHTKMLVGSTDKNMLDVFNQEVGLRLYTTLCKHIKRQRISVAGAIRLISDMNHYFAFIQTLKNKELLQYFKVLRELSQIYLIGPNDAKELATVIADTDRYLGIIRPEEVYEFAERRADWYHVRPRVEKAMYGIGCVVM